MTSFLLKRVFPLLVFSVFLIIFLFIFFRKDHTKTTDELRAKYISEFSDTFNWKGSDMHYIDRGEGVPVILLHGFAGSFLNWKHVYQKIPASYRLIVPDLPGFSLSDLPEIREEDDFLAIYMEFTNALARHLNLDSIYIAGNSMGGYIAAELAATYPEKYRKLVLVNAGGYDFHKIGRIFIRLSRSSVFDRIFERGVPYSLARRAAQNSVAVERDPAEIEVFYDLINRKETIRTISLIGSSGHVADTTRFQNIKIPTLIIWGEKDRVIPVEHAFRFNRDIRGSRVLIYPETGHVPMLEKPEQFTQDLFTFFN